MSDTCNSDTEHARHQKGDAVAVLVRQEGITTKYLRELLPEMDDIELDTLGENIESAIRDEVVRTLRERDGDE